VAESACPVERRSQTGTAASPSSWIIDIIHETAWKMLVDGMIGLAERHSDESTLCIDQATTPLSR
jgi:hypothetical protein